LYVDSRGSSRVLRYDERTGLPLPADGQTNAIFVPQGSGGLNAPNSLIFFTPAPVPEPGTLMLLGFGTIALLGYTWHRRRGR
jgi:PEP-CTERM motif